MYLHQKMFSLAYKKIEICCSAAQCSILLLIFRIVNYLADGGAHAVFVAHTYNL